MQCGRGFWRYKIVWGNIFPLKPVRLIRHESSVHKGYASDYPHQTEVNGIVSLNELLLKDAKYVILCVGTDRQQAIAGNRLHRLQYLPAQFYYLFQRYVN